MARITLIVLIALMLFTLVFYYRNKTQKERKKMLSGLALLVSAIALIYLTLTGRMHFLVALGAAILPFLKRLLPLVRYIPLLKNIYQQAQSSKQPEQGKTSTVETSLLKMTLDHDSGHMDGEILVGAFISKNLSDLSLEQLLALHHLAQTNYSDSLDVLEAYLDREIGESWRQQFEAQAEENNVNDTGSEISRAEAYEILGLADEASREEIIDAHRKLMQKLHPDRGGSNYLAAKLNQAKERLLGK